MSIGLTNTSSKEYLDEVSIDTDITEAMTDDSDIDKILKVESNNLISAFSKEIESVSNEVIASSTHVRNHKIVSTDMLSKV